MNRTLGVSEEAINTTITNTGKQTANCILKYRVDITAMWSTRKYPIFGFQNGAVAINQLNVA